MPVIAHQGPDPSLEKLNFQAMIKSAASTDSPPAWGALRPRWLHPIRRLGAPQAIREAVLAADLIMA